MLFISQTCFSYQNADLIILKLNDKKLTTCVYKITQKELLFKTTYALSKFGSIAYYRSWEKTRLCSRI